MNPPNTTFLSVAQPELRNLLAEASHALAHLDGDRLEEMASYCATLVGEETAEGGTRASFDSECRAAWREMAIFMRVLEATRANLNVMRRLRETHKARLEYGPSAVDNVLSEGSGHANH